MNLMVFIILCIIWALLSVGVLIYGSHRKIDYEWIIIICVLLNPFFCIMAAGAAGIATGILWIAILGSFIGPIISGLVAGGVDRK